MAMKSVKDIIGVAQTRNGKIIYDMVWHTSYDDFTEDDHEDASRYHFNQWETLYEKLVAKYGTSYKGQMKYEYNRRLLKHEANWGEHEKIKSKIRLEREIAEKKKRREEKAAIPLSKYEQECKVEKARLAKEFREKKKNLSSDDTSLVLALERRLQRLSDHHPQDSLHFGVSGSEERRQIRARIKSIINKSTNGN